MAQFRKKSVVIEATQWFKSGDHPEDNREMFHTEESGDFLGEGKVVRYYRHPDIDGKTVCGNCRSSDSTFTMHDHGWIDTLEGGHIVCPGDWIITGIQGERYPCKPDIFDATYEDVDVPWQVDGSDGVNSVGFTYKGVDGGSAHELELELDVNGHVGSCFLSPLMFEALKDHWEEALHKEYDMTYADCLAVDLKNFNSSLPEGSPPVSLERVFITEMPPPVHVPGIVAKDPCDIAPEGWWCSRKAGHEGPCAAWPDGSGPEAEEQAQYNARVEAKTTTVPRWVAMVLYSALDDIDTADDLAKGDDGLYRNLVRRYHQERHKVAQTDGHTVTFHAMSEQPEEMMDHTNGWQASPQYVRRLHNLVASMVEEILGRLKSGADLSGFELAWLSTFDDPDSFPEVTKIVNADKT